MDDSPEDMIVELLEREHGIPRSELSPSSRLLQDLGVDGDDAAMLFHSIHDRCGTDFTALDAQWHIFFNKESWLLSPRPLLVGVAACIPSLIAAMALGRRFGWAQSMMAGIAVLIFLALSWLLHTVWPKRELRPVTIAALAEIVRQGAWPGHPSQVG